MNLTQYIKKEGENKCAELFGVTKGCVNHWKNGARKPRPKQADKIVKATQGLLSYQDIYGSQTQ